MEEAVAVVDQLGRGFALGAERLAGRMREIGKELDEAAVLHDGDGAAPRDAEPAVTVDPLRFLLHRRYRRLLGALRHATPLAGQWNISDGEDSQH
jgi:hypothetical protein